MTWPYILYLPTYTAIAWYHKKLPADLQGGDVQKGRRGIAASFAVWRICGRLSMNGGMLYLPHARAEIIQKISRLTGLSAGLHRPATNLRIENPALQRRNSCAASAAPSAAIRCTLQSRHRSPIGRRRNGLSLTPASAGHYRSVFGHAE